MNEQELEEWLIAAVIYGALYGRYEEGENGKYQYQLCRP